MKFDQLIASSPCAECQFGKNSPFSPEIISKLKAQLTNEGALTMDIDSPFGAGTPIVITKE